MTIISFFYRYNKETKSHVKTERNKSKKKWNKRAEKEIAAINDELHESECISNNVFVLFKRF